MLISEMIEKLTAAGASLEAILIAVKAYEEASAVRQRELENAAAQMEEARRKSAQRSALYRSRGGDKIPDSLRTSVFVRDDWRCVYCSSSENLQCDHDVPVSKGGPTTLENLVTACKPCNVKKKDRTRKQFVRGKSTDSPRTNADTSSDASEIDFSAPTLSKKVDSIDEEKVVQKVSREVVARVNGTRLTEDWKPSPEDLDTAKKYLTHPQIPTEVTKFRNYWTSASGKGATKRNWQRTWENWCIRAGESGPRNRTPTPQQPRSWRDERAENTYRAIQDLNRAAGLSDEPDVEAASFAPSLKVVG